MSNTDKSLPPAFVLSSVGSALGTITFRGAVEHWCWQVELLPFDTQTMASRQSGVHNAAANEAFWPGRYDVRYCPFPLAVKQASCVSIAGNHLYWECAGVHIVKLVYSQLLFCQALAFNLLPFY